MPARPGGAVEKMDGQQQLNMNSPEDREALCDALARAGVPALQSELGGGMKAVEVVLISDDGLEALSILISSMDSPCEIGLSGFRMDKENLVDCASASTGRLDTLSQAIKSVLTFWNHADAHTQSLRAGFLDLNGEQSDD